MASSPPPRPPSQPPSGPPSRPPSRPVGARPQPFAAPPGSPGAGNPYRSASVGAGPASSMADSAAMRMVLPVGRSIWAIAAGYLGLLSILQIFAPFALAAGILAVIDIRKHPERRGMGRAIFGIVMGGLFTLTLVAMFIAVAISP